MKAESNQACAVFETGEEQLVCSNDAKTHQGNGQCVPVKQCDAEQGQRKQDEIERDTKEENLFSQCGLRPFADLDFGGMVLVTTLGSNWLLKVHAPFWPEAFFYIGRAIDLA